VSSNDERPENAAIAPTAQQAHCRKHADTHLHTPLFLYLSSVYRNLV
jgi:hypothetical protein